jgi:tape measure domain-containing protein
MPVVEEFITKHVLEDKVSGPAGKVRGAFKDLAAGADHAKRIVSAFATAYMAVTTAAAATGFVMMKEAAEYDALVAALTAVEGSADAAAAALKRVREIARGPGLGLEEAISGYTALRRSGLSQSMSERMLREFGNANAMSGGGKAELDRVLTAVAQISTKPFLQGDELEQLSSSGVPAYKLVKDIFGTSDTEELKKQGIDSQQVLAALVAELEKMPRVAGGAKNSFDNVGDALKAAGVAGGQALNEAFLPFADEFAKSLEGLAEDGIIKSAFETIAQSVSDIVGPADEVDSILLDVMENMVVASEMWRNVTLNIKGAAEGIASVWKWLNSPVSKIMDGTWDDDKPGDLPSSDDVSPFANARRWRAGADLEREAKRMQRAKNGGLGVPSDESSLTPPIDKEKDDTLKMLRLIEKNTRPIDEMTRMVLGGGELAAKGITPVELASRKKRRSEIETAMDELLNAIGRALTESGGINDYQMRRAAR